MKPAARARIAFAVAIMTLIVVVPRRAHGQDGFMFKPPIGSLTFRAGPMLYRAGGDLFDQITSDLTLERSDFRTPAVGAELLFMPTSRIDLAIGLMYTNTESPSEFKHWVEPNPDPNGLPLPIEQTTRLRAIPVTISLRYQLLPRGRKVGELAWIPRKTTPYVGAGGGLVFYRFEQQGDFINFSNSNISASTITSSGEGAIFHALAGADYWLTSKFGLNVEARYTHGSANPDEGFRTFDSLDLGGVSVTAGLSLRW